MRNRLHVDLDMLHGPILKNVVLFAIPLMLTGIFQLFYNAADLMVVGRFGGAQSSADMAAVGSTGSLINMMVQLFMGLSIGASVAIAEHFGAEKYKEANDAVHTAIAVSVVSGIIMGIVGIILAPWLLALTDTPADVMDKAVAYVRIYFAGLPASMVFNFGAAILRSVGDTRRPLYYLVISGVLDIIMNLIAVCVFHMGAAGVALTTAIAQVIAATLTVICLMRTSGCIHLDIKKIRIVPEQLKKIAWVGLPTGIQSTLFSISNVMIQSSINSFGTATMAGNAAGSSLDSFVNIATNSIGQASLAFCGQNMGARKYDRIKRIVLICGGLVVSIGLALGGAMILGGPMLLRAMFTDDAAVTEVAMTRIRVLCMTYFVCGLMDMMACTMRGMGNALMPMIVSFIGVCGIRLAWLFTVFARYRTLTFLYLSYPVTWTVTFLVHVVCFCILYKRLIQPAKRTSGQAKAQSV